MNRLCRLMIRAATLLVAPAHRERCREQWLADLEGAPGIGVSSWSVAFGALRTVPSIESQQGVIMPIGPLAVILRRTNASRRQVAIITLVVVAALAVGIALLLL